MGATRSASMQTDPHRCLVSVLRRRQRALLSANLNGGVARAQDHFDLRVLVGTRSCRRLLHFFAIREGTRILFARGSTFQRQLEFQFMRRQLSRGSRAIRSMEFFLGKRRTHARPPSRRPNPASLGKTASLENDRFELSAGVGPYRYFDTTAPRLGGDYSNTHGWVALWSVRARVL
jgi:hypothetical protein